jgi:CRISPR-associated protein Csd1
MSALASLVRACERLQDAPSFGYSIERIGFLISLNVDGSPVGPPINLREGNKRVPRLMHVPASFKRSGVTPRSFFLWDNTAFALGVSADEKKARSGRLEAFRELHLRELEGTYDPGLKALLHFIESWSREDFVRLGSPEEMKDPERRLRAGKRSTERHLHPRPTCGAGAVGEALRRG